MEERIVEVHWASGPGYTFHCRIPPLLQVCMESRAVALPVYHKRSISVPIPRSRLQEPIISMTGSEYLVTRQTYFNFQRDILYFPYRFPCSLSYGLALAGFLSRFKDTRKIQHLAITLPICPLSEGLEMSASSLNSKDVVGLFLHSTSKDSISFALNLQQVAREAWPSSISLATITFVYQDPMIYGREAGASLNLGYPHVFKPVENFGQNTEELWVARAEFLRWNLQVVHGTAALSEDAHSWGCPEVCLRFVDRRYSRDVTNEL